MEMTVWLCVVVVTAVIEALTAGLVTIWFTAGALAAMVCALFDLSVVWQVFVFLAVSLILLVLTRPLAKKWLYSEKTSTNADMVLGKTAVVVEAIDPVLGTGQVKIDGKVWSARSNTPIPVNETVTVREIQGVHVVVTPQNTGKLEK